MEHKEKRAEIHSPEASLELLYNINREIAAALDLHTVLQRVLFLSMKYVGAISGSLIVLDEQGQPLEAAIITGSQFHGQATQQLRATFEHGLAGWVFRHRQAVLIPDTSQDERWLRRPDDAAECTGPKSAVSAPVTARDQIVGVMTLVHPTVGFFNKEHMALVQAIADQAGIAVLNARLYAESQRKARVMSALAETAAVITASLKTEEVLQRILDQIMQALQVEVVLLALLDSQTQELVFHAASGIKSANLVGVRLELDQGIAGWVVREGQGAVVTDVREDPRFYPEVDHKTGLETKAIVCAPIRSQGEVIGVLEAINPRHGTFDPDALLLLSGIGSLAGTAIRHAQLFERLEAAHQRYRELFDDSIDPILISDWEGRILEANRRAVLITGYDTEALCRKNIENLQVVDFAHLGPQWEKLMGDQAISYESTLITEGGREIPVQVNARRVMIEGVPHIQWMLRDITERKNLDTLRDDLISMIYHDLRAPLTNVVSSLDVLEASISGDDDPLLKSLLEIAQRSAERIQRLTNSLLDMRQLETGQPLGNRQFTRLIDLVQEAIEVVLLNVENKQQEISIYIPEELPPVYVDTDMVRRVITNLVENAVKFTPAGSKIYLGARQEDDKVLMWVQDTGPGIPMEERERIFDKYTRLHSKSGPIGLGLGLAFCRLAIEAHGGRIWVEDGPVRGACFKLTLPTMAT